MPPPSRYQTAPLGQQQQQEYGSPPRMSLNTLVMPEIVAADRQAQAPPREEQDEEQGVFGRVLKREALTSNSGTKWVRKRLSQASTWWFVFFLVVIIGVGVVTYLFSRSSHWGGLSVPAWCIFIGASMLFWPAAYLGAKIVSFFICRALTKAGQYKIAYYINGSVGAARYLIWSIFFFIFWTTIFSLSPLPARERGPDGIERDLEPDVEFLWFVFRFLVVNIILAVYLGMRHTVVLSFRVQRQAEQFHEKVEKTLMDEEILDTLTVDIPVKFFKFSHRGRHYYTLLQQKKRRATSTLVTREQAVLIIQRAWRQVRARRKFREHRLTLRDGKALQALDEENARRASQQSSLTTVPSMGHDAFEDEFEEEKPTNPDLLIHQRLSNADYVKSTPLEVCNSLKQVTDEKTARKLARLMWDKYSDNGRVLDVNGGFRLAFKRKPDLYAKALALFDPVDIRQLEFEMFEGHVLEALQSRKSTAAVLINADSILGALSSFLSGCVGLLMFITLLIAFSSGPFESVALTIGTTFLALSFIFADSCRNVFNSFVFLFIRNPYDVGDRIVVNKGPDMFVIKLELMTTTFRDFTGKIRTIPNYVLQKDEITNIKRSGPLLILTDLQVHYLTSKAKLEAMQKEYRIFLATHPADFIESQSSFLLRGLENTNRLHIQLRTKLISNWQNSEHHRRRSLVIGEIMAICARLEITYFPPKGSVHSTVDLRADQDTLDGLANALAMRGGLLQSHI